MSGEAPASAKGEDWFDALYRRAAGDPGAVPWADLAPKPQLLEWLARNPGEGRPAIDVGCGLGDNAEALAAAGYRATAFDLSEAAVAWARERFPESAVTYRAADLFALPAAWSRAFELVHECYTIQALGGEARRRAIAAVADLVAPRGRLLVIAIVRPEGSQADGPPWPLMPSEIAAFEEFGLIREEDAGYAVERRGRQVPHRRVVFRRS